MATLPQIWLKAGWPFDQSLMGEKSLTEIARDLEYKMLWWCLRKNLGSAWYPLIFQTVTKTEAGVYSQHLARRQTQKLMASKKYKEKPESKAKRRKRKLHNTTESNSKRAKLAYGSNLDNISDVSPEKLEELCKTFMKEKIVKNEKEIKPIEVNTREQSNCDLWKSERQLKLTSSNFGKVVNRRPTNFTKSLMETIIYPKFKGNIHTIRGLNKEKHTITEYENKFNNKVTKAG